MRAIQSIHFPNKQQGMVLVVALVLLVAVTLLSLAGISTTRLELMMATNQQARVNAFQQAQTGIAAVGSEMVNFQVTGGVGNVRCTVGFDDSRYYNATDEVSCGASDLVVPSDYDLAHSRAAVRRLAPLLQSAPRFIETSVEKLKVATFQIDSRYDARDQRRGRAEHNQGIIITVLTPAEETVISGDDIDTN